MLRRLTYKLSIICVGLSVYTCQWNFEPHVNPLPYLLFCYPSRSPMLYGIILLMQAESLNKSDFKHVFVLQVHVYCVIPVCGSIKYAIPSVHIYGAY